MSFSKTSATTAVKITTRLVRKMTIQESSFRETSFQENDNPGNDRIPIHLNQSPSMDTLWRSLISLSTWAALLTPLVTLILTFFDESALHHQ